jgi:hypothetical protein
MQSFSYTELPAPRHHGQEEARQTLGHMEDVEFRLQRWLVYFGSGPEWYPAGEFLAGDATTAIERAIEIFGCSEGYRAEEIPWDAIPSHKPEGTSRPKRIID